MNKIAIIPAAGLATRIKGIPKFLLPINEENDKLITILLSSLSKFSTPYVITTPANATLLYGQIQKQAKILIGETASMSETVKLCEDLSGSRKVLFAMPDTFYVGDSEVFAKLTKAIDTDIDVAVGVWKIRPDQRGKLGQCEIDSKGNISKVVDKDISCYYPWAWGVLAWKKIFWPFICPETSHIGYALNPAIKAGLKVKAVFMKGSYFDCGTASEYISLVSGKI